MSSLGLIMTSWYETHVISPAEKSYKFKIVHHFLKDMVVIQRASGLHVFP